MTNTIRNICGTALLPSAPAERIELIPVGKFRTADGRPAFALDNPAAVIADSFRLAAGNVLPIDFDHRSFAGQSKVNAEYIGDTFDRLHVHC